MYCSDGSSMATLLQQKNCMKTLTNGGGAGSSGQAARVLLPHEMVNIPTVSNTATNSAIVHGSSIGSIQPTQQIQNHNTHHSFSNYVYYNPINSHQPSTSLAHNHNHHHHHQSHHLVHQSHQQMVLNATATSSSATVISSSSLPSSLHHTATMTNNNSNTNTTLAAATNSTKKEIELEQCNGIDQTNTNESATEQIIEMEEDQEPAPEVDIVINNVVCSFSVRCHLNLREIALNGVNVEFRRENGMVTMKLRRPYTTASIWSSGRITCTGATSEDQAKIAARRYARCLQKLGFSARFNNFRVVNVLGTCSMPWAIKIVNFSERYKKEASYEPELHPGVTYKLKNPKATLKIFSTGSITVTASSVANVQAAIEHIFPLVYEFRTKRMTANDKAPAEPPKAVKRKYPFGYSCNDSIEDNMFVSDAEDYDEENDNDH